MFYFDKFGFLTDNVLPDRTTNMPPPPMQDWPEGTRPNWTGYHWVYLKPPKENSELIIQPEPRLVSPRKIARAFLSALGEKRGVSVWAEIRSSKHPICVYWMSEYDTGEPVDPFYPALLDAIRLLSDIPSSTGGTILSADEPEAVIKALHGTIQSG